MADFFPPDWVSRYEPQIRAVPEEKVVSIIANLPAESWLRRYCDFASKQTAAPMIYHLGIGAALLAVSCHEDYSVEFGAWNLRPNMFVMLVGRSGKDMKSSALTAGENLIDKHCEMLKGPEPASKEGLIESLEERPRQMIFYSEYGKFLSSTTSGYLQPIKETMTDLWDSKPVKKRKAKGNKTAEQVTIRVEKPRLSIGAAVSIPYLERYTLAEDWQGGFMGRWFVLYGEQQRSFPWPKRPRSATALGKEYEGMAKHEAYGECLGLSHRARKIWDPWFYSLDHRKVPSVVSGIESRLQTLAIKLCLILGWDYGPGRQGKPWYIEEDILNTAIQIAELHLDSVTGISSVISIHEDARTQRSIIQAMGLFGNQATAQQLLKHLKYKKRTLNEMLETMEASGVLARGRNTEGDYWRLTGEHLP